MSYPTYISEEQLSSVTQLATGNHFKSVNLDVCTIELNGSQYELHINDEKIVSFFDISTYTTEIINAAINAYRNPLNINNYIEHLRWVPCEQDDGITVFQTPHENLTLRVTPKDEFTAWNVHYAKEIPNGYEPTYPSYPAAISAAAVYMEDYNPVRLEYTKLLHDAAAETYSSIDEIPEQVGCRLLDHEIYSFEQIVENSHLLTENKDEIMQKCSELAGTDAEPKASESVVKHQSKVTIHNI